MNVVKQKDAADLQAAELQRGDRESVGLNKPPKKPPRPSHVPKPREDFTAKILENYDFSALHDRIMEKVHQLDLQKNPSKLS